MHVFPCLLFRSNYVSQTIFDSADNVQLSLALTTITLQTNKRPLLLVVQINKGKVIATVFSYVARRDNIKLFSEIPSSAQRIAKSLCFSGGILKVRWPLNFLSPNDSGAASPSSCIHLTDSATTYSISLNASSMVSPWAASEGNSKHLAT